MGLRGMASALEEMYRSPDFLDLDSLSAIAKLIEPEYQSKATKKLTNRLRLAHLQEMASCVDSANRAYLPSGITQVLASIDFIEQGLNVCALGPSDSGKSYLAKALGISPCAKYRVICQHCEQLLESLVMLKEKDYRRFLKEYPGLIDAVSNKHVASFLGMTPVPLSRLRRKLREEPAEEGG